MESLTYRTCGVTQNLLCFFMLEKTHEGLSCQTRVNPDSQDARNGGRAAVNCEFVVEEKEGESDTELGEIALDQIEERVEAPSEGSCLLVQNISLIELARLL